MKSAVVVTSDKCYENRESVEGCSESDPLGGKDPYSASKAAAEMVVASYLHLGSSAAATANIASVRAGNVLGGGIGRPTASSQIVCGPSKDGWPVVIRNPGSIRPWQHVLEPLSGYLELGARLAAEGREYMGAWNFGPGPGNMVTVQELVGGDHPSAGRG